ncbi:MAG: single-stranded DNA-binding protein [Planctomycetia bacterium]|nr:single-stranded DNA-binding protein [Planctomycetia bacterium]
MASFNKVILLGNVTRDPELRYIANGTAVTDIGLAVNDRRKTATGEWVEETTRRPTQARYLGKGR